MSFSTRIKRNVKIPKIVNAIFRHLILNFGNLLTKNTKGKITMKNVIITGAAGQVGKSFVEYLSRNKNFKVYACDITFSGKQEMDNVEYVGLDITDEFQVVAFFKSLDGIDIIVNNAGVGVFTPFEKRTIEEFTSVFDVNMKGTFLMCREAVKMMVLANKGKIVNIGSVYGVVSSDPRIYGDSGRNNSEIYSMTKAAVLMLTQYLAAHYASSNIQINAISPGGVLREQAAEFIKNYADRTPVGRMANDFDLLPALEFLISDNNTYTNGQNIIVDGGFTAW